MIDPAHLRIETMASGRLTLVLRENASWADFEIFALRFLAAHGGTLADRADSPVERVWTVRFGDAEVLLTFDDAMARFEIDSKDAAGDDCVRRLTQMLGMES
jgi:hypothetical protein